VHWGCDYAAVLNVEVDDPQHAASPTLLSGDFSLFIHTVPITTLFARMMMMPFICSCRNQIGVELHKYLEEGTYHKGLFRGPSTNDMKK
jgi:hypothetical protein